MKRKGIMIFALTILIIVVIAVISYVVYTNFEIDIKNQSQFKSIYNNDISNLDIYVFNLQENKSTKMSNEDKIIIMDTINKAKIKNVNDILLGGYARLKIVNNITNKTIDLSIGNSQLVINNKHYQSSENILQKIENIIKKYDTKAIM